MPAPPKHSSWKDKAHLDFPEDWEAEAEEFLSDTEMGFEEAPSRPKFSNTLLIYGLPKVPKGGEECRFGKLEKAIKKKLSLTGDAEKPGFEMEMHVDSATKESQGCAWLSYPSKQAMEKGRTKIDGFKFGKDTIHAIPFDQHEEVMHTPDKFIVPAKGIQPLAFTDDNFDWLLDEGCRDQILLRFQQETEIHWIDILNPATLLEYYCGEREKAKGKVWCDWKVEWSRHGTYLLTFHKPGVCLWGGASMVQKRKLIHENVKDVVFCPNEKYLITWSGLDSGDPKAYKIWDIQAGKILKEASTPTFNPSGVPGDFPHMIFSPDSRFLARNTDKEMNIHQMPDMQLYKRPDQNEYTPFRFENGIAHYQFSPTANIVSVWTPQLHDSPSCLILINIETGQRLATRSRANFNAELIWQNQGDFLCSILSKKGKVKEGKELSAAKPKTLDVFRIREKNCPIETVDVDDYIKGFWWEPKSNRFALLTEHKEFPSKSNLYFYSLAQDKCEKVAHFELQSSAFNKVHWAPEGQYCVIAAMGSGELIWARLTDKNVFELLYKDEQVNLNHVEWDSTGRFILTGVIQPIEQGTDARIGQDAGFTLWTFQGRPLHSEGIEKLYGACFRPRPPLLLTEDEQKDIRRNLKQHSRRFEQIDDEARNSQRRADRDRKEMAIAEFRAICHSLNSNFALHAASSGWASAESRFLTDHKFRDATETVEELVETKEEFIDL